MIVEERIYSLNIGAVPQYLKLYEEEGLAIQRPILGRMVGYFHTEIGPQHQIVHLWAYRDLAGTRRAPRKAARRSALDRILQEDPPAANQPGKQDPGPRPLQPLGAGRSRARHGGKNLNRDRKND